MANSFIFVTFYALDYLIRVVIYEVNKQHNYRGISKYLASHFDASQQTYYAFKLFASELLYNDDSTGRPTPNSNEPYDYKTN